VRDQQHAFARDLGASGSGLVLLAKADQDPFGHHQLIAPGSDLLKLLGQLCSQYVEFLTPGSNPLQTHDRLTSPHLTSEGKSISHLIRSFPANLLLRHAGRSTDQTTAHNQHEHPWPRSRHPPDQEPYDARASLGLARPPTLTVRVRRPKKG
jgi:hypothetical protein